MEFHGIYIIQTSAVYQLIAVPRTLVYFTSNHMRDPSQFARLAYRLTSDNCAIYQQAIQMHIVRINKV